MPDWPDDPPLTARPGGPDLGLPLYGAQPPADFLAAVEADADLADAIAALSPKDKATFVERVFWAKDPERRAKRLANASRTILAHATGERDTPFDDWPKGSVVVDAILREVLAADLKAEGFKKKARTWTRSDDRGDLEVSIETSRMVSTGTGTLRGRIGGNAPGGPRLSIELEALRPFRGTFYEFATDDSDDIARVTAEVAEDWQRIGLPMVRALPDPVAVAELFLTLPLPDHVYDQVRPRVEAAGGSAGLVARLADRSAAGAPGS
ncbi:MAG: YdeI/OmpD-associated family protein [Aquihabitans sp.]